MILYRTVFTPSACAAISLLTDGEKGTAGTGMDNVPCEDDHQHQEDQHNIIIGLIRLEVNLQESQIQDWALMPRIPREPLVTASQFRNTR